MLDAVFNKDHSENVQIFSDIERKNNFSNYSSELNYVFGDKSYFKFYQNLVVNKKVKAKSFIKAFEKPPVKKYSLRKIDRQFDPKEFQKTIKNMETKINEWKNKQKNPVKLNQFNSILYLKKQMKKEKQNDSLVTDTAYLPEVPDVGRYNPEYNVVRKHIYQASFSTENFFDYNKERKKGKNNKYKNSNFRNFINLCSCPTAPKFYRNKPYNQLKKPQSFLSKRNSKLSIRNNGDINSRCSKNFKNKSGNIVLSTNNINNFDSNSKYNANHCLRFETYSPRKPWWVREIYESGENAKIPNLFHSNSSKVCIEFDKICSNTKVSFIDEIVNKNNNPPIGLYNPKYNTVQNRVLSNVLLDKKLPPSKKHIKLKEVIHSFDVPPNYQIITALNE